jgi:hypothetical protein
MSSFTTRVELHSGTGDDYATLHAAMEKEGFTRFIQSGDGKWYHLPWAEYNLEGNTTQALVLAAAQRASAETGRTAAILVSERTGATWSGLKPY